MNESLKHCQERIRLIIYYSVLKAMPMLRMLDAPAGEREHEESIERVVVELIRQVIDEGECNLQDNS